jgi:hypothetical protein
VLGHLWQRTSAGGKWLRAVVVRKRKARSGNAESQDTILVGTAGRINRTVLLCTPQAVVTRLIPPFNFLHIEVWVVCWLLLGFVGFIVITRSSNAIWVQVVVCVLAAWRAIEIIAVQASMFLDLDRGSQSRILRSVRRSLILLAINYLEVVIIFSSFYVALLWHSYITIDSGKTHNGWILLHESLITMVGNSSGLVHPETRLGWAVAIVQPIIGLFLLSAVVSRLISAFPAPVILDSEEHVNTGNNASSREPEFDPTKQHESTAPAERIRTR